MQIFELHFNSKIKEDYLSETFIHKPDNAFEKKLGNLYMVGELNNAIPKKSLELLENIARTIKKNYYSLSEKSQEKSFFKTLKKANDYLEEEVKNGNVNWLGNLNFASVSLKDSNLAFTITGNIRVILLRQGQVVDIGKNLNMQEIDPYPVKIFLNMASGKFLDKDLILIATNEAFKYIKKKGALVNLKSIKYLNSLFSKDEGSKISGSCLIIAPDSFKESIAAQNPIGKTANFIELKTNKSKISFLNRFKLKKEVILISLFLVLLLGGFLLFRNAENKKNSLNKNIEPVTEKFTNLERINDPEKIAVFPASTSSGLTLSYNNNSYSINPETCQITRNSQNWYKDSLKKTCLNPKSATIDGSIWVLNEDNSISRYHTGSFEEKIVLADFSPLPQDLTKIETKIDVPYLFFLEPSKKRIIITDKAGKIFKQIQSDQFTDLKDISISDDGKTVYVLNALEAFAIKI
jgi:hypothetical protein